VGQGSALVTEEGTDIMNELRAGAGWYADPAGTHELRYFDGRWTDQVATAGVVSTQPHPVASPAAWPADVPAAPPGDAAQSQARLKKFRLMALVLAIATAAVVTVVVATSSGSSSNPSAFCKDYAYLGAATSGNSGPLGDSDITTVTHIFQKLAGESPRAIGADTALVSHFVTATVNGDNDGVQTPDVSAAESRIDAYAQSHCNE
jgi:hypothetical protein